MADRAYMGHVLLLVLLAAIWGSSFAGIKIAIETIPPLTLVAVRLVIAGALLYLVLRVRGMRLPRFDRQWGPLFVLGLTSNTIPFFLISWGEIGIDSSTAAILMAVMPLVTVGLAHFFTDSDRMTPIKFVGLMLGFGGVVLLVGPEALARLGGDTIYELAVAGGAVFYAISAVLTRRLPAGGDPVQRGTAVTLCAALQMVPVCLIIDQPWLLNPTAAAYGAAVYLGIFPTAIAVLIYFHLIQERGTTFFAGINYMVPCMGLLLGVVFLGEQLLWQSVGALAIILSGVFVTNLNFKRQR